MTFRTRWLLELAAALAVAVATPAAAQQPSMFEALRAADMRLATVGWRLAVANAALCDRLEPGLGLQLHTIDQYSSALRDEARTAFGFDTAVAVEGVVPGSPAERAGIEANDAVVEIAGEHIPAVSEADADGSTERIGRLYQRLAELPPNAPVTLVVSRDGQTRTVTLAPVPACRSRFELRIADDAGALADGTLVQIPSGLVDDHDEEGVAALVAHELAHNILRHRERLEARGVDFGLLAGFGGNVKYFRQTEIEADMLSVYLLANAHYDPDAAARFWRSFGAGDTLAFLRARTHPKWRDRLATIEREAARAKALSARPLIPPLIATRDKPLDGDWQSLLVRHAP